jgi:hypothetical protein
MFLPSVFVRDFARLLWILVRRPNDVPEQKAALRSAMAGARDASHRLTVTELNVAVADGATLSPTPEELPWFSELAMRMSSHSVREIEFAAGGNAADVLGLARALASPPTHGDDGATFDAKMVALGPTTVTVQIGRQGFVRRATPMSGRTIPAPARTPAHGAPIVAPTAHGNATPNALREPAPQRRYIAEREPTPAIPRSGLPDETNRIYESALTRPSTLPRTYRALLDRLDGALAPDDAPKLLDEIVRVTEEQARDGLWINVADALVRMIQRDKTVEDTDVKRAFTVALRQLLKPTLLRGLAQLLPRRRELRDGLHEVFQVAGEPGADALVEAMVSADTATDRRAFRTAVALCPLAANPLVHLLGDNRWYVVRNAAELLAEMQVVEADGKLAATAKHHDHRVRRSVASALARLGTQRAQLALPQLVADKAPEVRLQAVLGLSALKHPRAVPWLLKALDVEEEGDIQEAILAALGNMPTAEAVDRLIRAAEPGGLLNRRPTGVRLAAVQALADAGTHASLAALRSMVNDRDRDVRAVVERLLLERTHGIPVA